MIQQRLQSLQSCSKPVFRLLNPAIRAYFLALLVVVGPEAFSSFLKLITHYKQQRSLKKTSYFTFRSLSDRTRLPTFCFCLIGLQGVLDRVLNLIYKKTRLGTANHCCFHSLTQWVTKYSAFLTAFASSWACLRWFEPQNSGLTTRDGASVVSVRHNEPNRQLSRTTDTKQNGPLVSSRTLDVTLFLMTRAVDAIVVDTWRSRPDRRHKNRALNSLSQYADSIVFALGSGTIMWAWFYSPKRLPAEYNKWIGQAAQVDERLILALRSARAGQWTYGEKYGQEAEILQSMCKDYGWPLSWGDPSLTIPIPCEIVHMGVGPSCHLHAIIRFMRTFRSAMVTNLPLQTLMKLVARPRLSMETLKAVVVDATRSSAFLASFVALMYYGICLSRTVLGPVIFTSDAITPQFWDSGMCVRVACVLCGASILIEKPGRRGELSLFVTPRALATFLPRACEEQYRWAEKVVLSLSISILISMNNAKSRPVRGLFGRLLHQVL